MSQQLQIRNFDDRIPTVNRRSTDGQGFYDNRKEQKTNDFV